MREFSVADAYTSAIGLGGPVQLSAGGTAERLRATSVTNILGVAANFVSRTGTSRKVNVFYKPEQEFEAQVADGAGAIATIADCIGANFSLLNFNTYNGTTRRSICELTGTGAAATALRQVRCVAVSKRIDKDEFSASWLGLVVQFQRKLHVFSKQSTTV
jgi:hypothetical protein